MVSNGIDSNGKTEGHSKIRTAYPQDIIKLLKERYGFTDDMVVADMGSGYGGLADLFLDNGNPVICIDPDENALAMIKKRFSGYANITTVKGSAEITGLKDHTVNVISAGRSFYNFNTDKARREFKRILKSPNLVVIVWNDRDFSDSFASQYDEILREYSRGYRGTEDTSILIERIYSFFNYKYDYYQMDNPQLLDLDGLIQGYVSSPYRLPESDPRYEEALSMLRDLFKTGERDGKVKIKYTAKVFIGTLI